LVETGYSWEQPAMSGLGYRQLGQFLRGDVTLAEAVALIKKETRRFVRQQYNWFRLDDTRIHWFDLAAELPEPDEAIKELIRTSLKFDEN
jgi:tRNA dimethylallyltransferase